MSKASEGIFICHVGGARQRALAIYQHLVQRGCDAFVGSPREGGEALARANIRARSHFLLLLTPSFGHGDRRALAEVKLALETERNIVPLVFNGFPLDSPATAPYPGLIRRLRRLQPLTVSSEYFLPAMDRLQLRLMGDSRSVPCATMAEADRRATRGRQRELDQVPRIAADQRLAEEWYELGCLPGKDREGRRYCLTRALEHDPERAEAWCRRGVLWLASGFPERAIGDLEQAIRRAPRHAEAVHFRGLAHRTLGRDEAALADFGLALELEPGLVKSYYNRANLYMEQGETRLAIADYNRVIELRPGYARAYNNRAIAYRALERPDLAMADYDRAVELEPENPARYRNRANLHLATGNSAGALRDYTRCLALVGGQGAKEQAQVSGIVERLRSRPSEYPPGPRRSRLLPCPCGSGLRYKACCGKVEAGGA